MDRRFDERLARLEAQVAEVTAENRSLRQELDYVKGRCHVMESALSASAALLATAADSQHHHLSEVAADVGDAAPLSRFRS